MRKVYYTNAVQSEKRFWEAQWNEASIEEAIKYCEIDYMRPILLKHFPPTGPILEGGCGLGQYVIYYQDQGFEVYGIDWVSGPICRIKKHEASARVLVGDIRQLPFKSGAFKVYYSNGVVEHFEGGPSQVLCEAHRVLDDDGLLVLTVPYLNVKRRLEDVLHFMGKGRPLKSGKNVNGVDVVYTLQEVALQDETRFDGYHFHEYMFTRREFARLLEHTGFRVLWAHGVGVQWGLMEFSWIRALYNRLRINRSARVEALDDNGRQSLPQDYKFRLKAGARRLLKDLLVSESSDRLMAKPLLWLLRALVGHLILFVCEKAT